MENLKFDCERCGHQATTKGNLLHHLKNKKICLDKNSKRTREAIIADIIGENEVNPNRRHKCNYCEKKFTSASSKCHHKKICPHRPGASPNVQNTEVSNDELLFDEPSTSTQNMQHIKVNAEASYPNIQNTDKQIEIMQKEITELRQIVKALQASSSKTTVNNNSNNTNTTNNTTNNIQNINIIVNTFGQEQLGHLTPEFLSNCIANPTKGFSKLIENIHYNPDVPENHNLRFKSSKRNTFERYDNEDWHECDASNTLEELIRKGYRILNAHYAEHFLTNPEIQDNEITRRAYERFRFLSDKQTQEYCAVKRDLRVLVKDRTAFILVAPDAETEVAA